jgi:hypothetical protein
MDKREDGTPECHEALLFEACPSCDVGDLTVRNVGGVCLAHCSGCGYRGELKSVYPLVHKNSTEPLPLMGCALDREAARTRAE